MELQQISNAPSSGRGSILQKNKRFVLLCVIVFGLAIQFWTTSRYPSLNEKAAMGDEVLLEDPLGFDVVYVVDRTDAVHIKVLKTTVNWAKTNQKGMTFGVLFAAALMGLFSILRKRNFKSSIANSSLGILIGAPLGVCVNCVTPVAQGIHNAGARLETTLAMMLSSPTLNIIVVTMMISLFPPYFVAIKLGLTLAFILFGIPLLARYFVWRGAVGLNPDLTIDDASCPIDFSPKIDPNETWLNAAIETTRTYFTNLWYIFRTAVPLMLLAGFLGAVVITLVPWDSLSGLFGVRGGPLYRLVGDLGVALIGLSIIAIVGIFLPVPIAFDVMIVAILFAAGMPAHYAMTLLFTLGIFSIYPFFIIWKDISRSVAIALPIVLSLTGVAAGLAAMGYHQWDNGREYDDFLTSFAESTGVAPEVAARDTQNLDELRQHFAGNAYPVAVDVSRSGSLSVQSTPFATRSGSEGMSFEKFEGVALGIDEPFNFSLLLISKPAGYRGTIATGDIHNDGWPDVVIGSVDHILSVYANLGDGQFALQDVDLAGLPQLSGASVILASLVDLNDDGWLDIFFTTRGHGHWVVYNNEGEFGPDTLEQMPQIPSTLTTSASFGDIDKDGDLDAALGNWSARVNRLMQNAILENGPDGFEVRELPGMLGATLTTLMTDFNDDGNIDLFAGSEFGQPDVIYRGDGLGNFNQIGANEGIFPHTTRTTMSITSADLNNDLMPELYYTQITGRSTNTDHARAATGTELCETLSNAEDVEQCLEDGRLLTAVQRTLTDRDTAACMQFSDSLQRDECVVVHLNRAATRWHRDSAFCANIPDRWYTLRDSCVKSFEDLLEYSEEEYAASLKQIQSHNVLLQVGEDGVYVDRAVDLNISISGWTWNSKFADLNNDGWVDLFQVNGNFASRTRESNYLYENIGGEQFVDRTVESGLVDYFPAAAYSYVDIDNDGDLDMITAPIHGPVVVYENNSGTGNSIAFELRDFQGNRFGVGSRVVIRYGDGSHQMREIQSGGGFASFDPAIAHFGLGEFDQISEVEIRWSTSETDVIEGPFMAGSSYRIQRDALDAADG
ncbi:MAG: uncharacterized membrane protein YraQ (UPF0718 family) [Yoonia sp.]|jgi:uncharacterized membrane protein YraQ (UPF0718 family)